MPSSVNFRYTGDDPSKLPELLQVERRQIFTEAGDGKFRVLLFSAIEAGEMRQRIQELENLEEI